MEPRAGGATDPKGSRGGHGPPLPAGPRARQLLARLDARPLAARAAADVAALVRRTGATLRLRPKAVVSVLDSADIEVTDNRLPNPTFAEHRPQHHRSETLGTGNAPPQVTQGFGLTLSGGRNSAGDAPLVVRRLLKDGPAQRCGRLQAGDLVLHINGQSIQGLTHAQVVERIRTGGPRLHLVLSRPLETHPGKPEEVGGPQKGDDRSPDPGGPEVMRSPSVSASWLQHPPSGTMAQTRGSTEPSPEQGADCPEVPHPARHTEDPDDRTPGSPGPWLVPSDERLSQALGIPGAAQLALEMAAGRRRH
ncbi:PDZ domain-containing protein MAGIX isoform X2 [Canis lupus baileyi]|uniref:PDZ domain-containing protein n=1 Tax=Canis lupus familiaris TaxID=9615 RepID=A0A8P0PKK7_CANLF|nr:PDZ domain-containing protein MAGIX isoform X2 [Canis lupus dingo]XP_038320467.1 PDZ domain-containing protein MAGIX isoform X3 [Canis lupus familiaris]XP_038443353.1 PDZ domain-containing protein MAGIX-like isoform X3 [Canis lupus familiaris]